MLIFVIPPSMIIRRNYDLAFVPLFPPLCNSSATFLHKFEHCARAVWATSVMVDPDGANTCFHYQKPLLYPTLIQVQAKVVRIAAVGAQHQPELFGIA